MLLHRSHTPIEGRWTSLSATCSAWSHVGAGKAGLLLRCQRFRGRAAPIRTVKGASGIAERASGIVERASGIAERASGIVERVSGIVERVSGIVERASGIV